MLTNLIVVILSQYIHVSDHHIVHLKLTYVICQYLNKPGEKHDQQSAPGNYFLMQENKCHNSTPVGSALKKKICASNIVFIPSLIQKVFIE